VATRKQTSRAVAAPSPCEPPGVEAGYDFYRAFGGSEPTDEEGQAKKGRFLEEVRRTVVDGITSKTVDGKVSRAILVYSYASLCHLPGYATLNQKHIRRIHEVVQAIEGHTQDELLQRPLNFLLLAPPGGGKSQLVKSIGKRLADWPVTLVTFNMATP